MYCAGYNDILNSNLHSTWTWRHIDWYYVTHVRKFFLWHFRIFKEYIIDLRNNIGKETRKSSPCDLIFSHRREYRWYRCSMQVVYRSEAVLQPASGYHNTVRKPKRNTKTTNQSNTTHEITQQISRKHLTMDVLTSGKCSAVNNEIIKQVTSSWSLFIQHSMCHSPHSPLACFP